MLPVLCGENRFRSHRFAFLPPKSGPSSQEDTVDSKPRSKDAVGNTWGHFSTDFK